MRADTYMNVKHGFGWKRAGGLAAVVASVALGIYGWTATSPPAAAQTFASSVPASAVSSSETTAAMPDSATQMQTWPQTPVGAPAQPEPRFPPQAPDRREALPEVAVADLDDAQREAQERAQIQAEQSELASIMASEAVNRDFREQARIAIDQAVDQALAQLESTGTQLVSSDCRSTLCRLQFEAADADEMNRFLEKFPTLLQWNTELLASLQASHGGVTATVFITRDGVSMPALAADQAS